ncbi:MAG: hypothetical protein JWQ06_1876 [Mucilaginibacter sp.]|nr:hypothetical protein [Mucilaginibacter sp.]
MDELQVDKGSCYSGTSNVVLPVSNKSLFPPEYQITSRLTYYASLFNSVEVNSSFYKLPMARTVQKWAAEVPDYFRFTFKLWKEITHYKELAFEAEALSRFMQTIAAVGEKKGCLLVQFPPSLSINVVQLENLLMQLQQENSNSAWKIAVEFRSRSWYQEEIYELLDYYQMGMVLHDLPASAAPLMETASDFIYLRFHGPNGGYRGSYTEDFLAEYASYIKEWQAEGKTVYVYFNNTMGEAVRNLVTLNRFVQQ